MMARCKYIGRTEWGNEKKKKIIKRREEHEWVHQNLPAAKTQWEKQLDIGGKLPLRLGGGTNTAGGCLDEKKAIGSYQARTKSVWPRYLLVCVPTSSKISRQWNLHLSRTRFRPWTSPSRVRLTGRMKRAQTMVYAVVWTLCLIFSSFSYSPND